MARAHSARSSKALKPNNRGTSRPGPLRAMTRARPTVTTAESTAAAMTIGGREATQNVERNSASRVAFPAIWKVIMTVPAAAAAIAARPSVLEPNPGIVTGQLSRGASEPEAGLQVEAGSFLTGRHCGGEGACAIQVREPDPAAEGGMPPVG